MHPTHTWKQISALGSTIHEVKVVAQNKINFDQLRLREEARTDDPLNLRERLQLADSTQDITDLFYHDEESIFYAALDKLTDDLQGTRDALPALFVDEAVSEFKSSIVPDILKDLEQARIEMKTAEEPLISSLESIKVAT